MKVSLTLRLIFICMLVNISCSKSKNTNDNEAPVITLNSPFDNQVFTAGQTIQITGTVTDNKTVAELHVHVNNNNTSAILLDTHQYPNSPSTNFTESLTAVAGIQYRIEILTIDAAVNESRKVIFVTCN
ncbi:MAG: DUF4625 domain-containing protein [Chitinophagaceae bacterium]|nr:DUF4625 domain-containing protein [Chitinophagaceae bacterium]